MFTSKDVAKLAGVSIATVSRVFTKSETVTDKTRERVMKAAKELNYTPNSIARSLKSNSSKTIGLVIPNIFNPFFFRVAAVMTSELEKHDYRIILTFNRSYNQNQLRNIYNLASAQVEAIAFVPLVNIPEVTDFFQGTQIYPLQILGNSYEHIDSILYDDYTTTCNITQYLIDKGHRNIMMLTLTETQDIVFPFSQDTDATSTSQDPTFSRRLALLNILGKNNIAPYPGAYIFTMDPGEIENIIEKALLEHQPTAVIAVSQEVLAALLIVIKKLNLNIPEDISIIAYDESPLSKYEDITTVGHDIDFIGKEICNLLLDHLQNNDKRDLEPQHLLMDTIFIERSSVKTLE